MRKGRVGLCYSDIVAGLDDTQSAAFVADAGLVADNHSYYH